MKVFLAGEGPDELGRWFREVSYRDEDADDGVLGALLRRVREDGWHVEGALRWCRIPKYRRGREIRAAEALNVLGLTIDARDLGCDVIAFVRDRDGYPERERDIEEGLAHVTNAYPTLRFIGGVAVEELEAWLLAMLNETRSEKHTDAKAHLAKSHGVTTRRQKIAIVEQAEIRHLPADARSLRTWMERARASMNSPAGEEE